MILRPAPLVGHEHGMPLQRQIWTEVLQALEKDVPEFNKLVQVRLQ